MVGEVNNNNNNNMSSSRGRTHLKPPDNLTVRGRSISPGRRSAQGTPISSRGTSPARQTSSQSPTPPKSPEDEIMKSVPNSSRTSLTDEEGSVKSEEYTVLDGVKDMNLMLVRQIETLRLKIKIDEKNYSNEKTAMLETKEKELLTKEEEIDDLKECLTSRDDKIHSLLKAGKEKDKTIKNKCDEIEELKAMVRQTKDYAQRIQKQVGKVNNQRQKLEKDPLYQQQNEEIGKLTDELETLRGRLTTMETELERAMSVIEQQNEKLRTIDAEGIAMQVKFREDLDKASRAMRQEVERMREVMRQNFEEMINLREQNKEMHNDVRAIKEMLKASRQPLHYPHQQPHQSQASHGPSFTVQMHGEQSALAPKGPGKMVGGNAISANKRFQNATLSPSPAAASPQFGAANSRLGVRNGASQSQQSRTSMNSVDSSGYHSTSLTARITPDSAGRRRMNQSQGVTPNSNQKSGSSSQNLPPICSMKESSAQALTRQPSARGGKQTVRKGSAVLKR